MEEISTLKRWIDILAPVPHRINCPEMQLIGRDFEPAIFAGPGYIEIKTRDHFEFTLFGRSHDDGRALERIIDAEKSPYNHLEQFRLTATDYRDIEWSCGYTALNLDTAPRNGWLLSGRLSAISTDSNGPYVCPSSSAELYFDPKPDVPMEEWMVSKTLIADREIFYSRSPARHVARVLDTEVDFEYPPRFDGMLIRAKTSANLPHPYAENWLGQPLTILFGQHIHPRLVARNFGDGRAAIWLRSSPLPDFRSSFVSLVKGRPLDKKEKFWERYGALLEMIASARGDEGHPNLETDQVTRFYQEIIDANQGSRWILALVCASVAEGLAASMMGKRRFEFDAEEIKSLKKHLSSWTGDARLLKRVVDYVPRPEERSIASYLKQLIDEGQLEVGHERAWSSLRNLVAHGKLVSPWPTEELDEKLRYLGGLVHRLTLLRIGERRTEPAGETSDPPSENPQ